MNERIKSLVTVALAAGVATFAPSVASALPVVGKDIITQATAAGAQTVGLVCDDWGRCWRTGPSYYGGGWGPGPSYRGGWGPRPSYYGGGWGQQPYYGGGWNGGGWRGEGWHGHHHDHGDHDD
jgi:hypothetical protein